MSAHDTLYDTACLVCDEPLMTAGPMRVHPTCEVDPAVAVVDVFTTLRDGILNQPRGLQRQIGPSEIGHPCARRLGFKLAGAPKINPQDTGVAWKPYVGTAIHAIVGDVFADAEIARWQPGCDPSTGPRWYVEERVNVGEAGSGDVEGNVDLFDAVYGIVYDWKFTTKTRLQRTFAAAGHPGRQYEVQAHSYGRGWQRRGFDVRHVAVIFMTRDGEFADRYVWSAPYDEQIAVDGLERVRNIQATVNVLGDEAFALLPAVESYCGHCPWYRTGETDLTKGCPGVDKDGNTHSDLMDLVFPGEAKTSAPQTPAAPKRRARKATTTSAVSADKESA